MELLSDGPMGDAGLVQRVGASGRVGYGPDPGGLVEAIGRIAEAAAGRRLGDQVNPGPLGIEVGSHLVQRQQPVGSHARQPGQLTGEVPPAGGVDRQFGDHDRGGRAPSRSGGWHR